MAKQKQPATEVETRENPTTIEVSVDAPVPRKDFMQLNQRGDEVTTMMKPFLDDQRLARREQERKLQG